MKAGTGLLIAAAMLPALSACGGEGGGAIASTPPPSQSPSPSPTPTPTPTPTVSVSIQKPSATIDFGNEADHAVATYDLGEGKVISSESGRTSLTVHYDAPTKSYTIVQAGRSSTFSPANIQTSSFIGESRYRMSDSDGSHLLTVVVRPYTNNASARDNAYVGLGYREEIQVVNGIQTSLFDIFAYGYQTPAAAVPKNGAASYDIDAFAMVAVPREEPKALQGGGTFAVDFLTGDFSTQAMVSEFSLASDNYGSGGNIVLRSAGHLGSGNSFSGNLSYTGFVSNGGPFLTVAGTLQGSFFGPNAEELGASFAADDGAGAHVAGALTGNRQLVQKPVTLRLDHIVADVDLPSRRSVIIITHDTTYRDGFRESVGVVDDRAGTFTARANGTAVARPLNSWFDIAELSAASLSPTQRPNFTGYNTSIAAQQSEPARDVHFDRYKVGPANAELALNYVNFGIWEEKYVNGTLSQTHNEFIVFGLETPKDLLSRRAGSGHYDGIAYGLTATATGTVKTVGGTSQFDVDFDARRFSGALDLTATAPGGPVEALGHWTFADEIVNGQLVHTGLSPAGVGNLFGADYNSIDPRFYGPNGEEIGAPFTILAGTSSAGGNLSITGVTVAKAR